eukprot:13941114-Heterocapsa_arctica.AAC.1
MVSQHLVRRESHRWRIRRRRVPNCVPQDWQVALASANARCSMRVPCLRRECDSMARSLSKRAGQDGHANSWRSSILEDGMPSHTETS